MVKIHPRGGHDVPLLLVNFAPVYGKEVPQHPNSNVMNRMTNVELFYDAGCGAEQVSDLGFAISWNKLKSYSCAQAGALELFQRDLITRKSKLIVLNSSGWESYAANMTISPLLRALQQLTGFNTVALRLSAVNGPCYPPFGTSEATKREWVAARQWERLYAELKPLLSEMSKALQPALGNSSAMSELVSDEDDLSWSGQRQIIFHPQDHPAAISQTKTDTVNMQQSMSTMPID